MSAAQSSCYAARKSIKQMNIFCKLKTIPIYRQLFIAASARIMTCGHVNCFPDKKEKHQLPCSNRPECDNLNKIAIIAPNCERLFSYAKN